MLATTAALVGASNSMRKGDRKTFNHFLRWRVAAQGFTVLAALGGSLCKCSLVPTIHICLTLQILSLTSDYAEERRKRKSAEAEAAFKRTPPPMPAKRAPPPTPDNQIV